MMAPKGYIFTLNSVLNEIKVAGGFPGGPMEENTKLAIGKANSITKINQFFSIVLHLPGHSYEKLKWHIILFQLT